MAKASDNIFPKVIESMNTTDPAAPSDSSWKVYAKAPGIYARSSNAIVGPFGAAGGNYSSVLWSSGTSMPGGPVTNQRVTRTDLGLDFYYDGTRWLTTTLYRETMGQGETVQGTTTSIAPLAKMTPWATTYDLWLDAFYASTYIATTNNGTNFWTVNFNRNDAAATPTSIVNFATSGDTVNNWTQRRVSIAAVYTASTGRVFDATATKTLSPGAIYWALSVSYRLIGT